MTTTISYICITSQRKQDILDHGCPKTNNLANEDDRNGPKENESNMIDEKTTNHHNYLIIFMKTFIHDAFHTQYSCLGVVKEYIGSC